MLLPKRCRQNNNINADSMADIAFLLLIFFLVTTTIDFDKGIIVKLPAWEAKPPVTPVSSKNVFRIKINKENQLLIEGEPEQIEKLKEQVKEFILNPSQKKHLAEAPNKAVISLQNDRGTSYLAYIHVYNEVKAAYKELWNEASQKRYGVPFMHISKAFQKEIKRKIPLVISEAEPTQF